MEQQRRQIAMKIRVKDLDDGMYIKEEGMRPNYVLLKNGHKVSRVNIIGAVIGKTDDGPFEEIMIDDGSSQISVRSFEKPSTITDIKPGQLVLIIGRPRSFGNNLYILPEITKPLQDSMWAQVRKLELDGVQTVQQQNTESVPDLVRKLDTGSGAPFEEIVARVQDGEEKISKLLQNGVLFEVSPGKLKVLD